MPDAPGYWARHRHGRVAWFYVEQMEDQRLCIWVEDLMNFLPVADFAAPFTEWYGPVHLPWVPE